jgi:hypothetical protein
MKRLQPYCPALILNVKPGDKLAGCHFKCIFALGDDQFQIGYHGTTKRIRGFSKARDYYNNLQETK